MGDQIADTQQELGAVISKPALTEKLLSRPPFRFLHDIFTAVTKATGFGDSLFSGPELDARSMDKEAKLAFLGKAIAVVSVATQKDCPARPAKIVSGLEADKTCVYLRMLAEAATAPAVSSEEAVASVLAGKAPGKAASSKPKAEKPKKPAPAAAEKKPEKPRERPPKPEKPAEKPAERPGADADRKGRERPPKKTGPPPVPSDDSNSNNNNNGAAPREPVPVPALDVDSASASAATGGSRPDKPPKPGSKPGSKRPVAREEYRPGDGGGDADGGGRRSGSGAAARPTTARGAPPKVVSNVRTIAKADPIAIEADTGAEETHGLILDGDGDDDDLMDDDDDDGLDGGLAGMDADGLGGDIGDGIQLGGGLGLGGLGGGGAAAAADDDDDDDDAAALDGQPRGALVNELMQIKKDADAKKAEEERAAGGRRGNQDVQIDNESQRRQDRKAVEAEIVKLREGLQKLTRSINPIGKSMDFVHEDLESMGRELNQWREINAKATRTLEEQRESTESSLTPLHNELEELEQKIADQNARIRVVKAKVVANDDTITRLLKMVVSSSG